MMWSAVRRGIQAINRGLSYAAMFMLLPMMLMTSADVVGRTFWRTPLPGTVEVSSYMLAVFVLLGVAYTHQVRGHVRVSLLTSRLSHRLRLSLNIVTTGLCCFITGILFWQGCTLGLKTVAVSDMLRIPQWPFKMLVAVGSFFLLLELFIELADTIAEFKRH